MGLLLPMIKKFKDKIKKHLKEVMEIKTSPHSIASGFAVGVFFGLFPTLGLEFFMMFLIILIFKKVSKIAMGLAYLLFNPIFTFPVDVMSYKLGHIIFGDWPIIVFQWELLNKTYIYILRYLFGSFIVASTVSIISYIIILKLVKKYQATKYINKDLSK